MPNWSYNTLTISGNESDMMEFYKSALKKNSDGVEYFSFSNLFPMPQKIKNTIAPSSSALGRKWMDVSKSEVRENKIDQILENGEEMELIPVENNTPEKCQALKDEFGVDNWYDWNIMSYGTKWDVEVDENEFSKSECQFDCTFDTAWSPPANFLVKLQDRFPKLDIELTWDVEGSDDCGKFYTKRDGDSVELDHLEEKLIWKSFDGEDIHFKDDEWRYLESGEVCDDYYAVNPLNGNER